MFSHVYGLHYADNMAFLVGLMECSAMSTGGADGMFCHIYSMVYIMPPSKVEYHTDNMSFLVGLMACSAMSMVYTMSPSKVCTVPYR